jgi:hypothetical protein
MSRFPLEIHVLEVNTSLLEKGLFLVEPKRFDAILERLKLVLQSGLKQSRSESSAPMLLISQLANGWPSRLWTNPMSPFPPPFSLHPGQGYTMKLPAPAMTLTTCYIAHSTLKRTLARQPSS